MSRIMKNQKSTSKYRKKGVAPIIPIIAIVEVLVLIAASTYAWYYLAANKTVETDVITVAPDSGLDIDFKRANTNDSINIWEYIDKDFKFEPATSLDGRNIFFPTSGTFGSVDTSQMTFRDATVNDINSKYINIDFELTNTNTTGEMEVYLNNSSYFDVMDENQNVTTSRALRLAFYPNDGSSGAVGSEMVNNDNNSESDEAVSGTSEFTVYFDNSNSNWSNVYAYFYDSHADAGSLTGSYPAGTEKNYWVAVPNEKNSWDQKKDKMTRISGTTYAYSFSNPVVTKATEIDTNRPVQLTDEKGNLVFEKDGNGDPIPVYATFENGDTQYEIVESTAVVERKYDTVIFYNGDGSQTVKFKLTNNDNVKKIYHYDSTISTDYDSRLERTYETKTVYFAKPSWWGEVYAYTWHRDSSTNPPTDTVYTSNWPGDQLKYVGAGVYSYEYDATIADDGSNWILFNNGSFEHNPLEDSDDYTRTVDTQMYSGKIYYVNDQQTKTSNLDKYLVTTFSYTENETTVNQYENMSMRKIYFYNSYGWSTPYVTVFAPAEDLDARQTYYRLPMTSLTGNVYYCTIPRIYTQAFFHQKNSYDEYSIERTKLLGVETTSTPWKDDSTEIRDGYVYRPVAKRYDVPYENQEGSYNDQYHPVTAFEYANHVKTDGYAVISPGASAGFQRTYAPVVEIDQQTGAVKEILPAFANSIDKYINNNEKMLFTLKPNSMLSLSMIIWLEGTDLDCDAATYANNKIRLRLEFSTQDVNTGETDVYTYRFYDKTEGIWTSNRQSTESGQTVAPVMQLYDETLKRGYLMEADPEDGYTTYDNKRKISMWTVKAPRSIADYGHEISFRRVNPYDEDEVWNYWEAGPCGAGQHIDTKDTEKGPIYKQALTVTSKGNIISFTAFGNGSPTSEMLTTSGSAINNVPDHSCGGLWGNHQIHKVYVLDGLQQPAEKEMHLTRYGGVLCINYTYYYNYTEDSQNKSDVVTVEYMGTVSNNSVYTFPVPQDIYDKYIHYGSGGTAIDTETSCTFKNYKNVNTGYALNSPKNDSINLTSSDIYVNTFSPTVKDFSGDYFEISEKFTSNDTSTAYNYWGSDILYFQTKYDDHNEWDTTRRMYTYYADDSLLRVHFFSELQVNEAGTYIGKEQNDVNDFFAVLYYNNNFQGQDSRVQGYACVIPNDRQYYFYRVERGNNACTATYNATKQLQLDYLSRSSLYANTNTSITHYNYAHVAGDGTSKWSQNICVLDYYYHTVYIQVSSTFADATYIPQCQVWNDGDYWSYFNDGDSNKVSARMTYVGSFIKAGSNVTLYRFKYEVPAYYEHMQFCSGKNSNAKSAQYDNLKGSWFVSGLVYENSGNNGSNMYLSDTDIFACNQNENVYAHFYAAEEWPHFNIASITGSADVVY